jgi:hypothetical protein
LEYRYKAAQEAFNTEGFETGLRGLWDSRVAWLRVNGVKGLRTSSHIFLADKQIVGEVRSRERNKGSNLSPKELLKLGLDAGDNAVQSAFTTDAMNAINASYYASEVAFEESTKLASMFVANRPLNLALGNLMASYGTRDKSIRIKELASGNRNSHWADIATGLHAGGIERASLTLTDFFKPTIERPIIEAGFTAKSERYTLLDNLVSIPKNERFHIIVTTYGIDSVWQP